MRKPFGYRLGQRADYGIAARLDFERPNLVQTERARDDAESKVPPIFNHKRVLIEELPGKLGGMLKRVAAVKQADLIPPDLLIPFGLTDVGQIGKRPNPRNGPTTAQRRDRFYAAVRDPEQLKKIDQEFRQFIQPILDTGVLLSLSIPNVKLSDLTMLRIMPQEGTAVTDDDRTGPANGIAAATELENENSLEAAAISESRSEDRLVMLSDVQLPLLLSANGRLGAAWPRFAALQNIRPMLEDWLTTHVQETLFYNDQATQDARQLARKSTPDVKEAFKKGNLLVNPGTVIDQDFLSLLQSEYNAFEDQITAWQRWLRVMVVAAVIILLGGLNGYYLVRNEPELVRSASRLSVYLVVIVVAVALGQALSFDPWRAEVIPLTATVMIFAIAYNQLLATLTGFSLSLILAFSTGSGLGHFVVLMSAATLTVIPLTQVSSRSTLIKVGLGSAVAYFVVSWGVAVIETQSLAALFENTNLLMASLRGAAWCLVSGFLVAGSLPFIESLFGVVTNTSLLELGDVSHPLLAELVRRAPGTYNHSITVASIAETAADSIGANGLLVKIGAYFHDIGKMVKPHYFVENMVLGETSRHNQLAPAMSTLIIIGHVKDGVDLAEQHGLPRPVVDFIEQHHGTTLVEYFYHAANKQASEHPDQGYDVQESDFRYPGPKPQTRELAVMMLSDAVESASRALSEPTPKRIESLVNDIARKRLLDGQFEECGLTLTELNKIQDSLVKSLNAIYHGRIKYPEQRSA
ncbi:MAG: metal dependent phosphohydrolase [Planctomycetaceae bacterium]|nr:metal dependent phosphohydrolase [Planctomycetaceae bacterium]